MLVPIPKRELPSPQLQNRGLVSLPLKRARHLSVLERRPPSLHTRGTQTNYQSLRWKSDTSPSPRGFLVHLILQRPASIPHCMMLISTPQHSSFVARVTARIHLSDDKSLPTGPLSHHFSHPCHCLCSSSPHQVSKPACPFGWYSRLPCLAFALLSDLLPAVDCRGPMMRQQSFGLAVIIWCLCNLSTINRCTFSLFEHTPSLFS